MKDDLISRKAAIDILKEPEQLFEGSTDFLGKVYSLFDIGRSTQLIVDRMRIETVPAIELERKQGEWITDDLSGIIQCDRCRNDAPMETTGGRQYKSNYCPNCGAEMKNGIQRSDKSETD